VSDQRVNPRAGRLPRLLVAVLVVAALPLAGCKEIESESTAGYEPAKVEAVKGGDEDLKRVTLTAEGIARTGLKTAAVESAGRHTVVPYAALLYDAEGNTFVYTSPSRRSFLRASVEVDRIEGNRVLLTRGPPIGTEVVTVGATQVRGAELEIAGS
jgi:hypothetical protein